MKPIGQYLTQSILCEWDYKPLQCDFSFITLVKPLRMSPRTSILINPLENNISRQIYLTDNPEVIHSHHPCISALFLVWKVSVHLLDLSVSSCGFLGSRHQAESDGSPSSDSNYKLCQKTRKSMPQVTKGQKKSSFYGAKLCIKNFTCTRNFIFPDLPVQPCTTETVTLTRKG